MESREEQMFRVANGLWRILQRKQNKHPEMFSEVDKSYIQGYKNMIDKNALPFDPKMVLRRSKIHSE